MRLVLLLGALLTACTDGGAYAALHPTQVQEVGRYKYCYPCDDDMVIWYGGIPITISSPSTCCRVESINICKERKDEWGP